MKNVPFLIIVIFILQGCMTAKFKIKSISDKFSDPKAPYGMMGENNRISRKSSQGGIHIDGTGFFMDPFVYKNRESNNITKVGFYVFHSTGSPDGGFRPVEEIVILTDLGERISVQFSDPESDYNIHGWNNISNSYNSSYTETATGYSSVSDFKKISNSTSLEIKVVGGKIAQTYSKQEVLPTFLINFKEFYNSQIISKE